jgi:putative transposase
VRYRGYRFPAAIISRCVWLYYRFNLSLRDIEELMAKDGTTVSSETIRQWCRKFGQSCAEGVRRRHPPPQGKWHCDEPRLTIGGQTHYLWRAVDRDGIELDILVHHRRNAEAARAFLQRLFSKVGAVPRVIVTDELRSYRAALAELLPQVEHRQHKGLTTRAENAHQPTRRRERGCNASSRHSTRRASWSRSGRSATTFARVGTCSRPLSTGRSGESASRRGTTYPARRSARSWR